MTRSPLPGLLLGLAIIVSGAGVTACGQKGPLYLGPPKKAKVPPTAMPPPTSTPAPGTSPPLPTQPPPLPTQPPPATPSSTSTAPAPS